MELSKNQKLRILEAYFDKLISKNEMKYLLKVGITILPIEWVYSNDAEQRKNDKKRALLAKVFEISFPNIEWV